MYDQIWTALKISLKAFFSATSMTVFIIIIFMLLRVVPEEYRSIESVVELFICFMVLFLYVFFRIEPDS